MDGEPGRFELWDMESANAVGEYTSEEAALRDVAEAAETYGADSPAVLSLALIQLDVPAEHGQVATGRALIDRALSRLARIETVHSA
jgi:hypothetical protein